MVGEVNKNKKRVYIGEDGETYEEYLTDPTKPSKTPKPKLPKEPDNTEPDNTEPDNSYMETYTELDPITYGGSTYEDVPEEVRKAYAEGTAYAPTEPKSDVMSYEEFFKEQLELQKKAAKERECDAVRAAEASYARVTNQYGSHAEQLSSLGLSNSGYSDYLKANAYTQMREDIAGAAALRAEAEQEANLTYQSNMLGLKEQDKTEKSNNFLTYFTNAQNGIYSAEDIDTIINANGFTGADADALRGAVNSYTENQNILNESNKHTISESISNGDLTSWSAVESAAKAAGLNAEDFKTEYTASVKDELISSINSGNVDSSMKTKLDELKELDADGYSAVVAKYNEAQDTSTGGFYYVNENNVTVLLEKDKAKAFMDEVKNDPYLSEPTKQKYYDSYNKLYTPRVIEGASVNPDDPFETEQNKNWAISIPGISNGSGYNANDLQVQTGTKIHRKDPPAVAAESFKDGTIFMLNGSMYIKHNGDVYGISSRDNGMDQADWNAVTSAYGDSDSSVANYVNPYS